MKNIFLWNDKNCSTFYIGVSCHKIISLWINGVSGQNVPYRAMTTVLHKKGLFKDFLVA